MKQVFETERISFVKVSECLINDYLTMVNDYENVNRFLGTRNMTFTAEQEAEWIQSKLKEEAPVFSMIEKSTGKFIGNTELMNLKETEGEFGIAITAAMQDRGFGTEAVSAMIGYGMNDLGLTRIFLRADPENARAIHVYEKCGYREYDRKDDHVFMEIYRQDHTTIKMP